MNPVTNAKNASKQQQDPLPNQALKIESAARKKPLIPNITLDPFSTAAIFSLYNVLNEDDRFGISGHTVFHQPSVPLGKVPYLDWPINSQTLSRKIYSSSREEASSFVIAILESISAYLKYESFKKMLPHLENGIRRYADSYGDVTDNAITSFQLAIDRIKEAIVFTESAEAFQIKHSEEFSPILDKNRAEFYEHWREDQITHVVNGIFLSIQMKGRNENCQAEVDSTFKYLEIKQGMTTKLLESKSEKLNQKT